MKVLVFGITDNPGGMEAVIMNYYRHLDRTRVQFDFLCNTEIVAHEQEILSLGGTIYRIPARSKDRKAFSKALDNFFKTHASEYKAILIHVLLRILSILRRQNSMVSLHVLSIVIMRLMEIAS